MDADRLIDALGRVEADGRSVREWRVFVTERRGLSLGIKDREAGNAHAPLNLVEGCGAQYLLVWSDGLVTRGNLERRQLEHDPEGALRQVRAAAYDDPDAAVVLGPGEFPEVLLHDAGCAAAARGETDVLRGRLGDVRRRVEQHGFRTWSGSYSATEGEALLVTSAGLEIRGGGTSTGWHVTLDGELGDGFAARAFESEPDFGARLDQLVAYVEQLARPGDEDAGGVQPVLLHPNVVERYVLSTLLHNLDGATVAHEEGHFAREQFGSPAAVLREDLGLRVDPLQPLRSGSYRFTAEGVPSARSTFVERGRLVQPVLSVKYARRLGLSPTAIAFSMDAVLLEGTPPLPLEQALERAAGGALVLSVLGVHTQDAASGDFSLSAPQTLRIGANGLAGRLRCTISGNLFELLRSDETRLVAFEGEHTPGLLVSCRLDPK